MSASFAFTLPVLSIIDDYTDRTFNDEHEVLQKIMMERFIFLCHFLGNVIQMSLLTCISVLSYCVKKKKAMTVVLNLS